MMIAQNTFIIHTSGRGVTEITTELGIELSKHSVKQGLCHLFIQHTSASLIICENADDQVLKDLEYFFSQLVPDGHPHFKHVAEGADDMSAHVRTILTQTSLSIPIHQGKLALGAWQGVYLYEHRYQPQKRHIMMTMMGNG